MKLVPILSALLCASVTSFARDTAYQALRAIGSARGQEILNRVIEVHGRGGAPQPASWKVVLDDQTARGGVREVEVTNGKIVSERTPVGGTTAASGAMNFQKLNLDSEGAFTIVEKEAAKAHLGFDSVDYILRAGDSGKSPVWAIQLMDSAGRPAGSMRLAADTGAVLRSDFYGRQNTGVAQDIPEDRAPPARSDEPGTRDDVVVRDDADYLDGDGEPGRLRVGHRINKALHQAGASLEEFFTGRRTMDRKYRGE
ncbi:MAG: hypothetical protein QOD99_619 [Chthoniobacter sp.]|nr:hypothetical protein [Chthoniobacter sp.]